MSTHRRAFWMFLLAWLLAFGLMMYFFAKWQAQSSGIIAQSINHEQKLARVVIAANRAHHYQVKGSLNGKPATFIIDTGASTVSVPLRLADNYGLTKGRAIKASTASDVVTVYTARIKQLSIGPIQLQDIRATLNPGMPMDSILLGMTALKKLDLQIRDGKLILEQHSD